MGAKKTKRTRMELRIVGMYTSSVVAGCHVVRGLINARWMSFFVGSARTEALITDVCGIQRGQRSVCKALTD